MNTPANSQASLTTYAQSIITNHKLSHAGFWNTLKNLCGLDDATIQQGDVDVISKGNYERHGYQLFCTLRDRSVVLRIQGEITDFICLLNGRVIDIRVAIQELLSWWEDLAQEVQDDGICLLLMLYLAAVEDDFCIDTTEDSILSALAALVKPQPDQAELMKRVTLALIYRRFFSDVKLTSEELKSISMLREAFALDREDADLVARVTVLHFIAEIAASGRVCSWAQHDMIHSLAEAVGLSPEGSEFKHALGCIPVCDDLAAGQLPTWTMDMCEVLSGGQTFNLNDGEVIHFFCGGVSVSTYVTETTSYRVYAGTRVKLGGLPIFLGGSAPVNTSRRRRETTGSGCMMITGQRVILTGDGLDYSIETAAIFSVASHDDLLTIRCSGHDSLRRYSFDRGGMAQKAAIVLKLLVSASEKAMQARKELLESCEQLAEKLNRDLRQELDLLSDVVQFEVYDDGSEETVTVGLWWIPAGKITFSLEFYCSGSSISTWLASKTKRNRNQLIWARSHLREQFPEMRFHPRDTWFACVAEVAFPKGASREEKDQIQERQAIEAASHVIRAVIS